MSVCCICSCAQRSQKRASVPQPWTYRLLWISMWVLGTKSSVSARVARALTAAHHCSPVLCFTNHHRACSLLAEVVLLPWGLASCVGTTHCHTVPQEFCGNHFPLMMGLALDQDREPRCCVPLARSKPNRAAGLCGMISMHQGQMYLILRIKVVLTHPRLKLGQGVLISSLCFLSTKTGIFLFQFILGSQDHGQTR